MLFDRASVNALLPFYTQKWVRLTRHQPKCTGVEAEQHHIEILAKTIGAIVEASQCIASLQHPADFTICG